MRWGHVGASNAAERDASLGTRRMVIRGAVQGGWCGERRRPARRRGMGCREQERMRRDRRLVVLSLERERRWRWWREEQQELKAKKGVHAHIAWLL